PVCRQGFERGALGRPRKRMRVLAHVERAIGSLGLPVVTDRLGDRENVSLGERSAQRRAAMPAGAKPDPLLGVLEIGPALKVFASGAGQVDQHLLGAGLAASGEMVMD